MEIMTNKHIIAPKGSTYKDTPMGCIITTPKGEQVLAKNCIINSAEFWEEFTSPDYWEGE